MDFALFLGIISAAQLGTISAFFFVIPLRAAVCASVAD
jgi:hypothetical protein